MIKLGYLETDAEDRVRPAVPALHLGYTVLSDMSLTELARPHLQEMADDLSGAAGLAVPDGADMRFVLRCESESQLLMSLRIGSRVPVAMSALGWAYLAGLPAEERDALIERYKPEARVWRPAEKALRRAIEDFETRGFILNERVFHPGYSTVAVPVAGPDGRPAFALNCGGAVSAAPVEMLVEEFGPRLKQLGALLASVVTEREIEELHG